MAPRRMLPDKPVCPAASCGMPHSGPMRGNSKNSTTITGAPSKAVRAASAATLGRAGRPTGMWASTSAVNKPQTDSTMDSATSSDCE